MRYKAKVAYDGTDFEGWQSQTNGNTVQDILEKRLAFLLEKPTRIYGASRTDSGVHARAQVFHFDAEWNHPLPNLVRGFRSNVPPTIQVIDVEEVPATFNARLSTRGKRYCYYLQEGYASPFDFRYTWSLGNRRLDPGAMQKAARHFLGTHDFTAFSGTAPKARDPNPVKTIERVDVQQQKDRYCIEVMGSGFLYKMVRSMVGSLVDVGTGRLQPEAIQSILNSRIRTAKVLTAPARGLFLDEIFY